MAKISTEQIEMIRENRKIASDLPVLHQSSKVPSFPISRIFEANLILHDDSVKQEAIDWIEKVVEISEQFGERNSLADEFISFRKRDNNSKISALNEVFNGFNEFRKKLVDSPYDPAEETQFFSDVNVVLGPMQTIRDVEHHLKILLNYFS